MNKSKLVYMFLGGLLALGLVFGGAAAFAQTDDGDTDTPDTPATPDESDDADSTAESEDVAPSVDGFRGHRGGNGMTSSRTEDLADALGITVDELTAAKTAAYEAIIAQAVADGDLTQAEADAILAGEARYRMPRGLTSDDQMQSYLADALGITVEELQAANESVFAADLAEKVASGVLTQEQADMIAAQRAVQSYVDEDAIQEAVQAFYADAIEQALADGVITQEQADTLLENLENAPLMGGGFRMGGRGHGPSGHGGHGGPRGFQPGLGSDSGTSAPSTNQTAPSGQDA